VNDTSDLIQNQVNGATTFDEHGIWFTTASVSEDATSYSEVESVEAPYDELVYPSRELPPVPVIYDRVATYVNEMNGVVTNEPQSCSRNSSAVDTVPYSGLTSSTREPPPAPSVYDKLTNPDYYNINNADNGTESGTVYDGPQTDLRISSTITPTTADASSYSELTSSTRQQPPAPSVYDKLIKPDYYNINNVEASSIISNEMGSDSERILSVRSLSEMETVL